MTPLDSLPDAVIAQAAWIMHAVRREGKMIGLTTVSRAQAIAWLDGERRIKVWSRGIIRGVQALYVEKETT